MRLVEKSKTYRLVDLAAVTGDIKVAIASVSREAQYRANEDSLRLILSKELLQIEDVGDHGMTRFPRPVSHTFPDTFET
jgi:hypothetical protein